MRGQPDGQKSYTTGLAV